MPRLLSGRSVRATAAAALTALAATPAAAAAPKPALEPVALRDVPLPAHVLEAQLPGWTPDGRRLTFVFTSTRYAGSQLGTVAPDGRGFRCLTCGQPGVDVGRPIPFPDDRRVLVRSPSGEGNPTAGYSYAVVECSRPFARCRRARIVPIVLPGRGDVLQTRELRVAPDGRHVAFTEARGGGWAMVLARLRRRADSYVLQDARLLNPRFRLGTAARDWARAGAFYEVKSFADAGRSVIYSSTADGSLNYDVYRLDLRTGRRTRLTSHPDWDEPLNVFPDGRSFVLGSSRTRHRMDGLGLVPRPPFFDLVAYAQVARRLLTRPADRACLVEPWLLDFDSERRGHLGQPLDPAAGLRGYSPRPFYSPSPEGRRVAYWVLLVDPNRAPAGARRGRLRVASLPARRAIRPPRARRTPTPRWAWRYDEYPLADRTAERTVRGARGGTARLAFRGGFVSGTYEVRYERYSDDGEHVLDGVERFESPLIVGDASYAVDLRVSGRHRGSMRGRMALSGTSFGGAIVSTLDGERRRFPPAACPRTGLPRLQLRAAVRGRGRGAEVAFRVTARVAGSTAPVRHAEVRLAGGRALTDARGRAALRLPRAGSTRATVRAAGFRAGSVRVGGRR